MCGRFSLTGTYQNLLKRYKLSAPSEHAFIRHYNASPGLDLTVIFDKSPDRFSRAGWGLTPSWFQEKERAGIINIKAESLMGDKSFFQKLVHQRCLIPADGFYEWDENKKPYRFELLKRQPFAFAGVWDINEEGRDQFAIVTVPANDIVAPVHQRMPAMLKLFDEEVWLYNNDSKLSLTDILAPYPADLMHGYRISTKVNSPRYDTLDVMMSIKE